MTKRLLGVFLLGLGLFLGYLSVLSPLAAAEHHERNVSVSMKGAALAPFCLVMGIIYITMGDSVEGLMGTRQHPTPLAYVIGFVLIGVGLCLYFWVKNQLESKGYEFH